MWKKTLLGIVGFVLVVIAILYARYPRPSLQLEVADQDYCDIYGIVFDASSIEAIYEEPEEVLQAGEQFRANDPAYRLFSLDRKRSNKPFPVERWERTLERLASLSLDKRKQQLSYRMYHEFEAHKQIFCKDIIPFIKSYLPAGTDLSATVYLTALENAAAGITDHPEIACSLSHRLFTTAARIHIQSGTTSLFNSLGHELMHIGYGEYNDFSAISEDKLRKNEIVIDILYPTHNEGLATYVSSLLSERYPIPLQWNHYLIERGFIVNWYIQRLNDMLALAGTPAGTEAYNDAYRQIGNFGYNQKGFYIVGAHMARTIEDNFGREVLMETVEDGFYAFAETYNSVAADQMKIHYTLR